MHPDQRGRDYRKSICILLFALYVVSTLRAEVAPQQYVYFDRFGQQLKQFSVDSQQATLRLGSQITIESVYEILKSLQTETTICFDPVSRTALVPIPSDSSLQSLLTQSQTKELGVWQPVLLDEQLMPFYLMGNTLSVMFKPDYSLTEVLNLFHKLGITTVAPSLIPNLFTAETNSLEQLFSILQLLNQRDDIIFAEPACLSFSKETTPAATPVSAAEAIMQLSETFKTHSIASHAALSRWIPDDPLFPFQWHLENTGQCALCRHCIPWAEHDLDAAQIWTVTRGNPETVIAIISTGIDMNHEDLLDRIVPRNGEDWNFTDPGSSIPTDEIGSGTAYAGLIAGAAQNGKGIVGLCPECSVLPLKVNPEAGTMQHLAEALFFATSKRSEYGFLVLCCPWTVNSGGASSLLWAIRNAWESGCPVVFPSGNRGQSQVEPPAHSDYCICATALSPCDERVTFYSCNQPHTWAANSGTHLTVAAPGDHLATTAPGNNYTTSFSGTGAAAALVSAGIGLIGSLNQYLTPSEIRSMLTEQADDLLPPGHDNFFGYGKLNVYKSIVSMGFLPSPTPVPSPELTWHEWEPFAGGKWNFMAGAVSENVLFCGGGYNSAFGYSDQFFMLDTSQVWREREALPGSRAAFSMVTLHNFIYAIGGETAVGFSSACDLYNPFSQQWNDPVNPADLPVALSGASCATDGSLLYVYGGTGEELSKELYLYDPYTDAWSVAPAQSPFARSNASSCMMNGALFIAGGYPDLKDVMMYIPWETRWITLAPLTIGRHSAGMAVYQEKIYVYGGASYWSGINSVEEYAPELNQWRLLESRMHYPRAGAANSVLGDALVAVGGLWASGFEQPYVEIAFLRGTFTPTTTPTITPTPSRTPYIGSPTVSPTVTRTPTPTISPTVTPSPTPRAELVVTLIMTANYFRPGDMCSLVAGIYNPGATYPPLPLIVMLDLHGAYFMWPSWIEADPGFDYSLVPVYFGQTYQMIIEPFSWPAGVGADSGLAFWGALMSPDISEIWGTIDKWEFGYGE